MKEEVIKARIQQERIELNEKKKKEIQKIEEEIETYINKSDEEIISDYIKMLDDLITTREKLETFAQMGAPLVRTKEKTLKKSQHQKDKCIKIKKEIMEKKYPQD